MQFLKFSVLGITGMLKSRKVKVSCLVLIQSFRWAKRRRLFWNLREKDCLWKVRKTTKTVKVTWERDWVRLLYHSEWRWIMCWERDERELGWDWLWIKKGSLSGLHFCGETKKEWYPKNPFKSVYVSRLAGCVMLWKDQKSCLCSTKESELFVCLMVMLFVSK